MRVATRPRATEIPAEAIDGGGGRAWAAAGIIAAVAAGIALRLRSPSALWLDESISVSISSLPLGHLHEALRHDGAPPLYAFLLWGWEHLFGSSADAVRALSSLFGIAALPVAALAGHRVAGRTGAVAATLVLATSPFAIYYSTEARMYSLVVLLVLCGFLLLDDYLRDPRPHRGLLVAVLAAALALTHYWALFLLAVVAGSLLVRYRKGGSRTDLAAVGWMAAGGILFLPWLPTFLFQSAHTATPWGQPAPLGAVISTVSEWAGGTRGGSWTSGLAALLLILAIVGYAALPARGSSLILELRGRAPGRGLGIVTLGTLVLALLVGKATGAAFAARYTSVALPLFVLLAATGVARLTGRSRTPVLMLIVFMGLAAALPHVLYPTKTQAPQLAAALRSQLLPGDVVVYCPDQLGPDTSRLLPRSVSQQVYPTGGSPARVDWVDYAARNRRADPVSYARSLSMRTGHGAIWLVSHVGYRTYEGQCEALAQALTSLRGQPLTLVQANRAYFEPATLRGWAPRP